MTVTKQQAGEAVTLLVEGRVDTNTSPQLQKEILAAFQTAKALTLDLEKVVYVSSAGLRALLIGQKTAASKRGSMVLLHVAPPVKAVLDSVGFSKILTIQ
ncbi:MAG: STAS domain-containing protein [Oscillibacter sp.]|nr:STAS domain-containing protein [Oscillibacter sp.]MCI8689026.1 STAS domain-containing protein [Oscillibacter sp.]MCI8848585.1 STAS domain-containing protein [Oscillibacter sp.]MCI9375694.1 STAS domain-containing protein [Oscillibacter sp.]MCI9482534.1 STAS domain-containing protein [Oscillibacter sp.]